MCVSTSSTALNRILWKCCNAATDASTAATNPIATISLQKIRFFSVSFPTSLQKALKQLKLKLIAVDVERCTYRIETKNFPSHLNDKLAFPQCELHLVGVTKFPTHVTILCQISSLVMTILKFSYKSVKCIHHTQVGWWMHYLIQLFYSSWKRYLFISRFEPTYTWILTKG